MRFGNQVSHGALGPMVAMGAMGPMGAGNHGGAKRWLAGRLPTRSPTSSRSCPAQASPPHHAGREPSPLCPSALPHTETVPSSLPCTPLPLLYYGPLPAPCSPVVNTITVLAPPATLAPWRRPKEAARPIKRGGAGGTNACSPPSRGRGLAMARLWPDYGWAIRGQGPAWPRATTI
jgi:hypothetical protein